MQEWSQFDFNKERHTNLLHNIQLFSFEFNLFHNTVCTQEANQTFNQNDKLTQFLSKFSKYSLYALGNISTPLCCLL